MTEAEWLAATDPLKLLAFRRDRATDRKRWLFAVACCRRVWHRLPDPRSRAAVEMVERFADGQVSAADLAEPARRAEAAVQERTGLWGGGCGELAAWATALAPAWNPDRWPCPASVVSQAALAAARFAELGGANRKARKAALVRGFAAEQSAQAALVRDLLGNPFRPAAVDPRWRTADVLGLAEGIYHDRAFERLPLLADGLMDAGCDDEQLIGHCRSEGPHVRGCWVVDLVLGRE